MRVDMTPKEYQAYVKRMQKKSPLGKDMALAFVIGGLICVVGQVIGDGFRAAGLNTEDAGTATSVSLVDFKAEGFVTGMAAKMFVIAGPVIVYGTLASAVYGVVLWALG